MLIIAIDNSDGPGRRTYGRLVSEHFLFGSAKPITMSSTEEMVTKVLIRSISRKIACLSIIDHGSQHHISIGNDEFHLYKCFPWSKWRYLHLLCDKFHDYGYVHLFHCLAGQDKALIKTFAQIWRVPVVAHTGYYNGVDDTMDGNYVQAYPDGRFEKGSGKPTLWTQMRKAVAQGKF